MKQPTQRQLFDFRITQILKEINHEYSLRLCKSLESIMPALQNGLEPECNAYIAFLTDAFLIEEHFDKYRNMHHRSSPYQKRAYENMSCYIVLERIIYFYKFDNDTIHILQGGNFKDRLNEIAQEIFYFFEQWKNMCKMKEIFDHDTE